MIVHVHLQCRDEGRLGDDLLPLRQQLLIETIGVVANLDDFDVRLVLPSHLDPAVILQGEDGLDAAGAVVTKGQGHGAGGRYGEELAVSDTVFQDLIPDCEPPVGVIPQGHMPLEEAGGHVLLPVQPREASLLLCQIDGRLVGRKGDQLRQLLHIPSGLLAVVAQSQHDQGVGKAGIPQADGPVSLLVVLVDLVREGIDVDDVVQHTHGCAHCLHQGVLVQLRPLREGVSDELVEHQGAQVAGTAVLAGGQFGAVDDAGEVFCAGVGADDGLLVPQGVIPVHIGVEEDTGLPVVVCFSGDGVPKLAGVDLPGDLPLAGIGDDVAAVVVDGPVEGDILPPQRCGHKRIIHHDAEVEVVQCSRIVRFRIDEVQNVGVVDIEDTHVRAAPIAL